MCSEVNEETEEDSIKETRQNKNTTYQMVGFNYLEEVVNQLYISKYMLNSDLDDFVQYCLDCDNQISNSERDVSTQGTMETES